MRRAYGFTLIELMVVVSIIAVILAIAIPSLLRSRVQTNEAAAVESLRVIAAAQMGFHAARNRFGDFEELTSEVDGEGTGFLDESWSEGVQKTGYVFSMALADATAFVCFADPVEPGNSGRQYYRVDTSGIIRHSESGHPTPNDSALGSQ